MYKYRIVPRKDPQTKAVKFYATADIVTPVGIQQLVEEISAMCTLTRADVKAALLAIEDVVLRHIRDGQSVRFGDLGSFRLALHSAGSPTEEGFTSDLIKSTRVRFVPSSWMKNALSVNNPAMSFQKNRAANTTAGDEPEEEGTTEP